MKYQEPIYERLFSRMTPAATYYSFREDGDQSLVTLDGTTGPVPVNKTAAEVLQLCNGSNTVVQIYETMKHRYDSVSSERLFYDVTHCIRDLEKIKAISIQYA